MSCLLQKGKLWHAMLLRGKVRRSAVHYSNQNGCHHKQQDFTPHSRKVFLGTRLVIETDCTEAYQQKEKWNDSCRGTRHFCHHRECAFARATYSILHTPGSGHKSGITRDPTVASWWVLHHQRHSVASCWAFLAMPFPFRSCC